ncbi:MAG: NlpC/P60 family protein, partial [Gallionellaceae bacterium]|nr:NlpC/P60 family protein [Gallionellaceae bacterium]
MGQNVFVAGYSKFQLGTNSKADVEPSKVKNTSAIYEYQYGGTGQSTDGVFKGVDCSYVVWRSLKDAGYQVPDQKFGTSKLFNGDVVSDYANTNFDFISKSNTLAQNGNLQVGDIIMFRSKTGNGQHVGIFFGYDAAGDPLFYGSQTSTGPAIANMTPGSTWNGKSFDVVGALRPKDSFYNPANDTTLTVTDTPQSSQSFIDGVKSD